MRLRFNEAKATEAAARLIELRGGKMSYRKLINLLYLADREALLRWGRPITTDRYVSMDHGPVVSNVYELIRAEPQPGSGQYWRRFVSAPDANYDVSLLAPPSRPSCHKPRICYCRRSSRFTAARIGGNSGTSATLFPNGKTPKEVPLRSNTTTSCWRPERPGLN